MPDVDIAELEKQYEELGEMIEKLGGSTKGPCSDDADMKAKVKKERVPLKKKELEKAKAKASDEDDSDEDAADGGDDEEYEDDVAPAKTKKAAAAAEEVEVKKVEVADEEIVFKGQTIKKSAVGEIQFNLVKSMSEELTKNSEAIAKAQDEAILAKLEKRADDEFSHVPGTTAERAAMLKAVSKMDEALVKSFEAVFAQSEKLAKGAFATVGVAGGDSDNIKKSADDFIAKVSEIQKRDGSKRSDAMAKARSEHPDLFKAYQAN